MADTIPSDVPGADAAAPAAPTEQPKTPREIALEQMEARHQRQMAESNGYDIDLDDEPSPAPAPAPVDQLEAQLAAQPATEAIDNKVRIKVDGIETDVPLDEVVRQYQKNSSADRRLAEATRLLREAEATQARLAVEAQEAQLRAQQQQHQQPHQAATDPIQDPAAPETEASGKEFLKALFEGDEENALAALQKVVGGRQQAQAPAPTLDIDQIASAVTQQVQQKFAVESALNQHQRDYPELYADPDLEALALAKVQRLRQQDGSDFFTALDAVSRDMATKFGWSAHAEPGRQAADPAPTTSNRTAKLEAKRQIDNVSSVNTKTTSTEQQPENPSDVIAAMRAARLGA